MLYFREAERLKGNTGENLLMLLTRRLDNVVLSAGFALTLSHARQLVNHGHFLVNGKRVSIASYQAMPGDVIGPRPKENTKKIVSEAIDVTKGLNVPGWLQADTNTMTATITGVPGRSDFQFPIQEQLIVELCSK
jgi:small subunit ribosomal protein S4